MEHQLTTKHPLKSAVSVRVLKHLLEKFEDTDQVQFGFSILPPENGISIAKKYESLARKLACMLYEARTAVSRLAEIEESDLTIEPIEKPTSQKYDP